MSMIISIGNKPAAQKRQIVNRLLFGGIVLVFLLGGIYFFAEHFLHGNGSSIATIKAAPALTAKQFQDESKKLNLLMQQKGIPATFEYVTAQVASSPSFAKSCHPLSP